MFSHSKFPAFAAVVIVISFAQRLPAATAIADAGYVDSRVCATCHRQIAEDYAKTGMGRSFFRPAATNAFESYTETGSSRQPYFHDLSGTYFSMVRRNGQYYQRRWQIGFGGEETNVEEMKVDYVMGSGNHARSYLHRTARGALIELPLGWYADNGGHWGMSPGSDSDHPRTRRFVSYKCMFCHNAVPQIPLANETPGSDPIFAGDLPEGIDCQRCHGPGAKHVQTVQTAGSKSADVRASIVNPSRLTPKLRMEICMQCHLETSSGRIPATVVKFNRRPFSYSPGEPLEAFMLSFDHAPGTGHDDKFEAVSSVYRLRKSQCFIKSEGRLTCDTCHNPHRAPRGEEAVSRMAAACRQCHAQAIDSQIAAGTHTNAADCAGCHMPKRRAEDTPGMVMTDHLIQRRPKDNLLAGFRERGPEEYRGEIVPYYPAPLPVHPTSALYLAIAQVGLENNSHAGLPVLAREIARQKPADAEFYQVLGDGWLREGNRSEAILAYQQAARLNPRSLNALRSLAEAFRLDGQMTRAAETLERALQIEAADPITWYRYGMLDFGSGNLIGAAEKIRKAIALDPTLPEQSRSLAEVLVSAGQTGPAQNAVQEALRADPYDDAAWDLAGRLRTANGELPEAIYDFEKAIRLRPGFAPHLYDLALSLVRADRFDEAQDRVEAALRADPKLADAHELLGGLFARKRRLPEAEQEYRQALKLDPGSASAHLHLGNVLAAKGDTAGAVEHLRVAAAGRNAKVAEQAHHALQQMGAH